MGREPRILITDEGPHIMSPKRIPNSVIEKTNIKNSSRPAYSTVRIQTHGTNSVRKLPEQRVMVNNVVCSTENANMQGLARSDDQRPNNYISQHFFMNSNNDVLTTKVVEPHTSWSERLCDRPYAGADLDRHGISGECTELGVCDRLDDRKTIDEVNEFRNCIQTRDSGERQEFGHALRGNGTGGMRTLLEDDRPDVAPWSNPQPYHRIYTNTGFIPPKHGIVSIHQHLAGLYDTPSLRYLIDCPYHAGDKLRNQMRSDKSHNDYLEHRRQFFGKDSRKDYIWNAGVHERGGVYRRTGMLSDLEVRSHSCNPRIQQSVWPHRCSWLEHKPEKAVFPAREQYDYHANKLVSDRRGYSRCPSWDHMQRMR